MTEPLLHWPTPTDVLWCVIPIAIVIAIHAAASLAVGAWLPFSRTFTPWVCVQILNAIVRSDVMIIPNLVFWLWLLFGSKFPWDKWGKKLKAKASSLTEVATAALKRQQTEAFS